MRTNFYFLAALFTSLFFFLMPSNVSAHTADQSYIYLRVYKASMDGRFEATAVDLNRSLGLNLSNPMKMSEIEPHLEQIKRYLLSKTSFSANNQQYNITFGEVEILPVDDPGDYLLLHFTVDDLEVVPESMEVQYEGFFDKDSNHKGWLITEYNWKAGIINNESLPSLIFSPSNTQQSLSLAEQSLWKGFVALVKLGIWHIWIGLDHILFIIALILPAVVRRRENLNDMSMVDQNVPTNYSKSWLPVSRFKPAFIYIISIITFFTIAHSITLALASLEVVSLPSRLVESIIAISIALAAIHNITPIVKGKEWIIAFLFGLFHGFGFASVLGEKGLAGDFLPLSLFGFNVGVEIGQVLIICAVFPILFFIRKSNIYPKIITYGSALLILISIYWFLERALDVEFAIGRLVGL